MMQIVVGMAIESRSARKIASGNSWQVAGLIDEFGRHAVKGPSEFGISGTVTFTVTRVT